MSSSVCSSGRSSFFTDPDGEIDLLQAAFAKEEATAMHPAPGGRAQKLPFCLTLRGVDIHHHDLLFSTAGVPPQREAQKPNSGLAPKSQARDAQHAKTTAPLPDASTTPQPSATKAVGGGGPLVAPTIKDDKVVMSECEPRR